jgi:hypothetical protein
MSLVFVAPKVQRTLTGIIVRLPRETVGLRFSDAQTIRVEARRATAFFSHKSLAALVESGQPGGFAVVHCPDAVGARSTLRSTDQCGHIAKDRRHHYDITSQPSNTVYGAVRDAS